MDWQPIETLPERGPVLVCGEDPLEGGRAYAVWDFPRAAPTWRDVRATHWAALTPPGFDENPVWDADMHARARPASEIHGPEIAAAMVRKAT